MAKEAREKLAPWADGDDFEKPAHIFAKNFELLGTHDGVGVWLRIAHLDVKGTGRVTDNEAQAFYEDMDQFVDGILGFLTNCMVISTLVLSISIPLAVFGTSTFAPSSDQSALSDTFAGWAGNLRVLHVLHWIDSALLSSSLACATWTLFKSNNCYSSLALYMPDAESKMRMATYYTTTLGHIWFGQVFAIVFLLFALPFLAARVSPAATVCGSLPFVLFLYSFANAVKGETIVAGKLQQDYARRILKESREC